MAKLYENRWTSTKGNTPSDEWIQLVGTASDETINSVLSQCFDRVRSGEGWPPVMAEFCAMFEEQGLDFDESYYRMKHNKQGICPAERATFRDVGYQCRTLYAEDRARRIHRQTLIMYLKKQQRGELKEPKALPKPEIVKSKLCPDNFVSRSDSGLKLQERIKAIASTRPNRTKTSERKRFRR